MTKKNKVMVVYDDAAVRSGLKDTLDRYSEFDTAWVAGTLADAVSVFKNSAPDLMFLGLRLPDGNGLQVLQRAREACPGVYVVIFTSFYPYISQEAYNYGEDDYLLNPFTHDELDKVLRRYLAVKSGVRLTRRDEAGAKPVGMLALRTLGNELMPVVKEDIALFRYDGNKKLWEAVFNDSLSLSMRKGTVAKDILKISPIYRQCHQSYIVNICMVKLVGMTHLRLCAPFTHDPIPIGRTFCKALQDCFKQV